MKKHKRIKPSHVIGSNQLIDAYLEKRSFLFLLFLITALILIVFWDFISLKSAYLFKDIGSDSINYFYPHYAHLGYYARSTGIPQWSFNHGMGQNIFPFSVGEPFAFLYLMFGKGSVAYAFIYVEIAKILTSGIFFYLYLRLIPLRPYAAIIGALVYSFSGYLILTTSAWYNLSYEPMFVALLLYAIERFLQQRGWRLLPITVAMTCAYQPFYVYLLGMPLLGYTIIRLLEQHNRAIREIIPSLARIAGFTILGLGISSIFFFSNLMQLLQSPRVCGEAAYFSKIGRAHV